MLGALLRRLLPRRLSLVRTRFADVYALYFKTKNFHWHLSGPHFRDYHKLFDQHAEQLIGMTDAVAERVRKIGGMTLHSIGESSRLQRIADNERAGRSSISTHGLCSGAEVRVG